ncbi:MAG: hypothetical protein GY826_27450, partial [Fuerstiella sp.]|nr:hypothetical protein [Fuerstiella sp.]
MTNRRTLTNPTESVASSEVIEACGQGTSVRTTLRAWLPAVLLVSAFVLMTGCRSFRPSDGEGLFAKNNLLSTKGIRGPLERALSGEDDVLTRGARYSEAGQRQAEAARKLFDEKKYPEALKRYKAIAQKYPESSAGEEAWFRVGECRRVTPRSP